MFDDISPYSPGSSESDQAVLLGVEDGAVGVYATDIMQPADLVIQIDGQVILPFRDEICHHDPLMNENQLANADFADGAACWTLSDQEPPTHSMDVDLANYTFVDNHTLFIKQYKDAADLPVVLSYRDPVDGDLIPVLPNVAYVFSAYFGCHRCTGELLIDIFDAERGFILQVKRDVVTKCRAGSSLGDYQKFQVSVELPQDAAFVQLHVRKFPKTSKDDSYLFLTLPWFGRISGNPMPDWRPAPAEPAIVAALRRISLTQARVLQADLPLDLLDGGTRQVAALDRRSGRHLPGSPCHYDTRDLEAAGSTGWRVASSALPVVSVDFDKEESAPAPADQMVPALADDENSLRSQDDASAAADWATGVGTVPDDPAEESDSDSRRTDMAVTEPVGARSVKIVFFPDYRPTNPYQKLMYRHMPGLAEALPGKVEDAIDLIEREGALHTVVLHLHWLHPVLAGAKGALDADFKRKTFIGRLRHFIRLGGTVLWTVHNVVSHDAKFPEVERRLCEEVGRYAARIHIHSRSPLSMITQAYALPEWKLLELPHPNYVGYYLDYVAPATARSRLGLPPAAPVFLFLGQLRPYKGIEELVAAFTRLSAAHPDAQLLIVGSPVFPYTKGMLKQRFSLFRNVRVIEEHVPDNMLQWYYKAADWVVLPYRSILTSGSLMCALSMGRPVIAPLLGMIGDVVTDGENGLLYDADNPQGLSAALQRAVGLDRGTVTGYQDRARDSVEHLTWADFGQRMMAAIEDANRVNVVPIEFEDGVRECLLGGAAFPPERPARVAVIVLNYEHIDDVEQLSDSLKASTIRDFDFYVVDNASPSLSWPDLVARFGHDFVLRLPANLGYAAGNNAALRLIRDLPYEFVWVVNPDVVVTPGALEQMLEAAEANPDISIFGPVICHGHRPGVIWFGGGFLSESGGINTGHMYSGEPLRVLPSEPYPVDYITGASLFLRKPVLEKVGLIPEHYFLYFEETEWCWRARQAGETCLVIPSVRLLHNKRSEQNNIPAKYYFYYYIRNILRFALRVAPDSLNATRQHLQEAFIDPWLSRIRDRMPAAHALYGALAERALADGYKDLGGSIDLIALETQLSHPDLQGGDDAQLLVSLTVGADGKLRGWVMNRHRFASRYRVTAVVGDEIVASTMADQQVDEIGKDVDEWKRSNHIIGDHGFAMTLPNRFYDGRCHKLTLRVGGLPTGLADFQRVLFFPRPAPKFKGRIDGLKQYRCTGWLIDSNDPDFHPTVEIVHDGEVIGTAVADEFRDDLLRGGINAGYAAFSVRLPRCFSDGQRYKFQLRVAGETEILFEREVTDNFVIGQSLKQDSVRSMLQRLFFARQIWLSRKGLEEMPVGRHYAAIGRELTRRHQDKPQPVKVSIIMPAFNRAATIDASIRSVIDQPYRNWELLIIDDGSVDGTLGVIDTLLAEQPDDRIRVIALPQNQGVSAARNVGLKQATGDIIAYLDSDNVWKENFLLVMVNEMIDHPEALTAYCGQEIRHIIPFNGKTSVDEAIAVRIALFDMGLLESRNFIDLNCYVHRRVVYERLGGFNEIMRRLVDWELILRYSAASTPHFVPAILSSYYFDKADNQITRTEDYDESLKLLSSSAQGLDYLALDDPGAVASEPLRPVDIVIVTDDRDAEEDLLTRLRMVIANSAGEGVRFFVYASPILAEKLTTDDHPFTVRRLDPMTGSDVLADAAAQLPEGSDLVVMTGSALVAAGWLTMLNRAITRVPDGGVFVTRRIVEGNRPEARTHVPFSNGDRPVSITLSNKLDNVLDPLLDRAENLMEISHFDPFCVYLRGDCVKVALFDPEAGLPLKTEISNLADYVRSHLRRRLVYCGRVIVFDAAVAGE